MGVDLAEASRLALRRHVMRYADRAGLGKPSALPANMTFLQWVTALAEAGLQVDRKPFRLDNRRALIPIYEAIPSTPAEARDSMIVIQKATQLGLTVWEVLADLYLALRFGPVTIGLFLPTQSIAHYKSQHRFLPIVRSHPDLYGRLIHREDPQGDRKRVGEGNVLTRQFADSLMVFSWTSGRVTTESIPMDIVSYDEVQEMTLEQIDKVRARMGDSWLRFGMMLSTANMPDLDINHWYQLGTQEVWHTLCRECGAESDLSDPNGIFPARSTAWNTGQIKGAPRDAHVWTCPVCQAWIPDPQDGRYIAQQPRAWQERRIRSFLLPRTISPRITAGEIVTDFARAKTGDQKKSFFNRTLARPYIDPSQTPVTLAALEQAARAGMELGLTWQTRASGTYMGVDQMGGWNAVIIKRRLPDGRQAVVHVEAIHGDDPFAATADLMDRFGVSYCVVEQLPNVNDARRFANRFPGRVYLASYADLRDDMMIWGDDLSRSDRRTAAEDRTRHHVTVSQYKAMQRTLYRLRDGECLWPDPDALQQVVPTDTGERRIPIVRDMVWTHYLKTALIVEQDPETRRLRTKVAKVGLDPHFSFATMLCDIAWSRDGGSTSFVLLDAAEGAAELRQVAAGRRLDEIGVPPALRAAMQSRPVETCGTCHAFRDGLCTARSLRVAEGDMACPIHVPRRAS